MSPREGCRASEARNASRSVAGTTRDERDTASRRPPPLARRDEASRAPRGVRALEQRTTLPCGPFLAVPPGWLHRGIVGFGYELLEGGGKRRRTRFLSPLSSAPLLSSAYIFL